MGLARGVEKGLMAGASSVVVRVRVEVEEGATGGTTLPLEGASSSA